MALNFQPYDENSSRDFYSELIFDSKTVKMLAESGSILTKIKNNLKVPSIEIGQVLQEDSCDFTPQGDVTQEDREIYVCKFKINFEECVTELEDTFEATKMAAGAMNSDVPSDLQTYILDKIKMGAANEIETLIWRGDTSVTGNTLLNLCDGYFKKFLADGTVLDVAATTVTSANVIAEIEKVHEKIPDILLQKHDDKKIELEIMVSTNVMRAYKSALATSSGDANFKLNQEIVDVNYKGIKVINMPDFGTNKMVCTFRKNLWFATDLVSDFETLSMIDMRTNTGDDKVRMKGRMMMGVQYAFGKYIVFYS